MYPEAFDGRSEAPVLNGGAGEPAPGQSWKLPHRTWLHVLLLLATLFTTTAIGARMQRDFQNNLPFLSLDSVWPAFTEWVQEPWSLLLGLPFSLTLLGILMAHEMGHYLACIHYSLDTSLPYFLPAPVLTGTFGAFIRIRSPIYTRRTLFDVAVAGPLAGFVLLVPAMAIGLAWSKVIPGIDLESGLRFGNPPFVWLLERAIFPGVPARDFLLHPIARAAYIGMLATAWNLLPAGQLDGGHIVYSLSPTAHRLVSLGSIAALILMGRFVWTPWLFWAGVLLLFARRHPPVQDPAAPGGGRDRLAWMVLVIFALCFTPAPFEEH